MTWVQWRHLYTPDGDLQWSTAVGVGWGNDYGDKNDTGFLNLINSYQNKLYTFGDGMYPNEAGSNVPSFSTHFWGSNYGRLLKIKQEWDPDNTFTCLQCVGYTASTSSSEYSYRGSICLVSFLVLSKLLFYCDWFVPGIILYIRFLPKHLSVLLLNTFILYNILVNIFLLNSFSELKECKVILVYSQDIQQSER